MTAKEFLREWVESMSEEEAEEKVLWLDPHPDRSLTPAEAGAIERGLDDARAGRLTLLEDIEREFERD